MEHRNPLEKGKDGVRLLPSPILHRFQGCAISVTRTGKDRSLPHPEQYIPRDGGQQNDGLN
jgi:hypothetical protein